MSSPRAQEYRELIDDVIAGAMLEQDEIEEIKSLIARAKARIQVAQPITEQAAE
jgi:hypothetical protein